MNPLLRWKYFWLAVWVFGMGLGTYLSLMPTTQRQAIIPHLDKLIHGSGYAALAVIAACIFSQQSARWKAIAWLVVFGGLIELAQGYLPTGRAMEFSDVVANSIGIAIGTFAAGRWNIVLAIEQALRPSKA